MKKLFSLILLGLLCLSTNVWGGEETYYFSSFTSAQSVTLNATNFNITLNKNTGATNPAWNANASEARIYAAGSLVISSSKLITKVEYEFVTNANSKGKSPSISSVKGSSADGTWNASSKTWQGSDYTVTLSTTGSAGNLGFTSVTVTYSENGPVANSIEFTPAAGTYETAQNVSLTASLAGSTIYYTTNGDVPTTSSAVYSTPISITTATTIKALAVKTGSEDVTAEAAYIIKPAQPSYSIDGNAVSTSSTTIRTATNVEISAAAGCNIYYTTDNVNPSTSSTAYTGAISITETTVLKAIAVDAYGNVSSYKMLTLTFVDGTTFDFTNEDQLTSWGITLPTSLSTGTDLDNSVSYTLDGINVQINKGGTNSTRIWNGNNGYDLRLYGTTESNGSIVITAPATYMITQVTFDGAAVGFTCDGYKTSSKMWLGNATNLSFIATSNMKVNSITVKTEVLPTNYNLTIGSAGYATYFNSLQAYTMPTNMSGWIWYEGRLQNAVQAGEIVAAGEPLVLKAPQGNYTLTFTNSSATNEYKEADMNDLDGTDIETALTADANSYFYGLSLNAAGETNSVGFYWMNATGAAFTNGAHKAYLKVAKPAQGTAPIRYLFNGENEATAIETIEAAEGVQKFIENGKLVIVKDGVRYNALGQTIK